MFTSTLTNIVIGITDALSGRRPVAADTRRQAVSFSLYFSGALIAGLLAFLNFNIVIMLPVAAMVAALVIDLVAG